MANHILVVIWRTKTYLNILVVFFSHFGREMIVVYLRLASGGEMANRILVVICAPKHI